MPGTSYCETAGETERRHLIKPFGEDHCRVAIRRLLPLALLLCAVLWISAELGVPLLRCSRSSHASQDIILDLDSFSQPAIAATILRQEAERLFDVYVDDWNLALEARDLGQSEKPEARAGGTTSPRVMEVARAIESLALLHREASSLKADLDCKLLAICSEQCRDSDSVGYYMQLLHDAPGDLKVLQWAQEVLASAQRCGRKPEVLAGMVALIRSHPDLGIAPGLQSVLNEHGAATGTPFEVSHR